MTRRMATMKYAQPVQDGKVTAMSVLARPQTHWKYSSRSRKRKRTGTETAETSESESYNGRDDSDGSIRKRRRLRVGSSAIIQRVEDLATSGGLPANTNGVSEVCVSRIPITGRLSEALPSALGPRRSQRFQHSFFGFRGLALKHIQLGLSCRKNQEKHISADMRSYVRVRPSDFRVFDKFDWPQNMLVCRNIPVLTVSLYGLITC